MRRSQRQPVRLRLITGGAVAPQSNTSSAPQATALQAPGGPSGLRAPRIGPLASGRLSAHGRLARCASRLLRPTRTAVAAGRGAG